MNYDNDIDEIKGFILIKSGRVYDPFLKIDKIQDILIKDGIIVKVSTSKYIYLEKIYISINII